MDMTEHPLEISVLACIFNKDVSQARCRACADRCRAPAVPHTSGQRKGEPHGLPRPGADRRGPRPMVGFTVPLGFNFPRVAFTSLSITFDIVCELRWKAGWGEEESLGETWGMQVLSLGRPRDQGGMPQGGAVALPWKGCHLSSQFLMGGSPRRFI